MEVKPGYRQSEAGIIPNDWNAVTLGDCLTGSPDYGINAPAVPFQYSLPTYLRITDITDEGYFSPESIASVDQPNVDSFYLGIGDLVFARTGASVGKSYLYNPDDGGLVFAGYLIRVRVNSSKLLPEYLAQYVKTETYWNWVKAMSMRSGQPGINGTEYAKLPVPIPPEVNEQRAIAEALSDADAAIQAMDRLIAKKRNIKQGAMQELLTGKRRLPGFSGEWQQMLLGSMGTFRGGNGFPTKYQGEIEGDYPFFKVSDMNHQENTTFMISSNNWISETTREAIGAFAYPKNTIVFAKIGAAVFLERKRILAQEGCIDNNMMGFIVDKGVAYHRFVHFILLHTKLGKLVATTALPSLNSRDIAAQEYLIPPKAEQQAISNVLSDMDTEISALEAECDKLKAIKQGMMQELLTGKTRLV